MEKTTKQSVFEVLSAIDCSEHIEKKKQGSAELSYLSWAWAWSICKKNFPNAFYTIYERPDGVPYFTDGRTCWVKTGVTIEGQEYIEYLPIMDFRNQSIFLDKVTSFDMNKAIQRSLTKALARHGLGLYIYAGEDLPEATAENKEPQQRQFNPEPVQTPPLESQNISVAGLFPTQDMPDTIMDDLSIKINAATTDIALKGIFQDAKVLLAKRPDDLSAIKTAIIKKQRSMSNGQNS